MIFTVDEYRVITYLGKNYLNHAYTMLTSEVAVENQERDVGFIISTLKSSVFCAMTANKKKKKSQQGIGKNIGNKSNVLFGHIKTEK